MENHARLSKPMVADPAFAPVADAFAGAADVTAGRMMSSFGLKVNGKIFAMHARGQLVAKLPKPRVDALVAEGVGEHFDPGHGRRMKEWIAVDAGRADWVELAREAYAFVKETAPREGGEQGGRRMRTLRDSARRVPRTPS